MMLSMGAILISSLSARRAWIEIVISAMTGQISVVALRKESVDRNYIIKITGIAPRRSLSARRAWIEMMASRLAGIIAARSLSARRAWIEIAGQPAHGLPSIGRSPQGERG